MQPDNKNDTYRFMRERPLLGEPVCIDPPTRISGAAGLKDPNAVESA